MTHRLFLTIALGVGTPALAAGREPQAQPLRVATGDGATEPARQPQVAVDAAGRFYVAFGVGNSLRCAVSEDGGASFRTSEVGSVPALALGMRRGPRIATSGATVCVTAIGGEAGGGRDGDLLAWRSVDGAKSWTGPIRVNSVEGSAREGLHAMAAGTDGRLFAAWLDLRSGATELYGASSTDGGASWGDEVLVYHSPDRFICECCHPSVAFGPDGVLYAMWRNQLRGARDLYLARSTDGGATFEGAEKLGRRTWILNACPMDGGAVAAGPDGAIETIWMRAGETFRARPGTAEQPLGRGVQPWAAWGEAGPYLVWLEQRPGRLLVLEPGSEHPRSLAERASDPTVGAAVSGEGPAFAAWEDASGSGAILGAVLAPAAKAGAP